MPRWSALTVASFVLASVAHLPLRSLAAPHHSSHEYAHHVLRRYARSTAVENADNWRHRFPDGERRHLIKQLRAHAVNNNANSDDGVYSGILLRLQRKASAFKNSPSSRENVLGTQAKNVIFARGPTYRTSAKGTEGSVERHTAGKAKKKALRRPLLMSVFENRNASPAADSASRYFPLGLHHRHYAMRNDQTTDDKKENANIIEDTNFVAEPTTKPSTSGDDDERKSVFGVSGRNFLHGVAGNRDYVYNIHKHRGNVPPQTALSSSEDTSNDVIDAQKTVNESAKLKLSMEALRECLFLRSGCVDPRRQREERERTSAYLDKVQALMRS